MRKNHERLVPAFLASMAAAAAITALQAPAAADPTGLSVLRFEFAATGDELTKLRDAAGTLDRLLAAEKLWANFTTIAGQYPKIFVGPEYGGDGTSDGAGALALLRGRDSRYAVFPAQLTLTGTYYPKGDDYSGTCTNPAGQHMPCRATSFGQNYSNELVVTHGLGITPANQRELVSIEIGREVFNRFNAQSKIRKSCTFNTLAHEWAHTIGKNQASHWTVLVDTGSNLPQGLPKLTYLFGSVAQCTWLQEQKEIGADGPSLKACVARFGTGAFNSLQCV